MALSCAASWGENPSLKMSGIIVSELSQEVAMAFEAIDQEARRPLMEVRDLIFELAASAKAVGALSETLKWGQPSYLTARPKTGTTIRLGQGKCGGAAMFFHCQTTLVAEFRDLFADEFTFEGNRAVILKRDEAFPTEAVRACLMRALTYHLK